MQNIKKYFMEKSIGYYLTIPALICLVLAHVLYTKNGITQFQPKLDANAIAFCWIAFGLALLSLVFDCKYIRFLSYLCALYSFMMFIYSQVTYIANVMVSIDGNSFSGGFIATAAAFIAAGLFLIVGVCLSDRKNKKKEEA